MSTYDIKKHPAFGQVRINKVYNTPLRLYGSAHPGKADRCFYLIRITKSEKILSDVDARYSERGVIAEVALTPAQLTHAILSTEEASGVPCTILFTESEGRIRPIGEEDEPLALDSIRYMFKAKMDGLKQLAKSSQKAADELLSKGSRVTATDRKELHRSIQAISTELKSNINFILESFQIATEKMISEAKAEIDAYRQGPEKTNLK